MNKIKRFFKVLKKFREGNFTDKEFHAFIVIEPIYKQAIKRNFEKSLISYIEQRREGKPHELCIANIDRNFSRREGTEVALMANVYKKTLLRYYNKVS